VSCTTIQDRLVGFVHFIVTGAHRGCTALDSVVLSGRELGERELGAGAILHVARGRARTNPRDPL
jgi:hypothetical protein